MTLVPWFDFWWLHFGTWCAADEFERRGAQSISTGTSDGKSGRCVSDWVPVSDYPSRTPVCGSDQLKAQQARAQGLWLRNPRLGGSCCATLELIGRPDQVPTLSAYRHILYWKDISRSNMKVKVRMGPQVQQMLSLRPANTLRLCSILRLGISRASVYEIRVLFYDQASA